MAKTTTAPAASKTKVESFLVSPKDIILKPERRGRHFEVSEAKVIETATSLLENGQQQPIVCRPTGEGKAKQPEAVFGFHRTLGALRIMEGFTDLDGKKHKAQPDYKIRVELRDMTDEQAIVANFIENEHRTPTSDIDKAYIFQELIEHHGKSQADCARLIRAQRIQVSHIMNLLKLSVKHQKLVHEGRLSRKTAQLVLRFPDDKRDEVVKASIDSKTKKVIGPIVAKKLRDYLQSQDEPVPASITTNVGLVQEYEHLEGGTASNGGASTSPRGKKTTTDPPPRHIPLTRPEILAFFVGELDENNAEATENTKKLCAAFVKWAAGEIKTPKFSKTFDECLNG